MLIALALLAAAPTRTTARPALGTPSRADSTPGSRALARVLDEGYRHRLEESPILRLNHGLPIERLPDLSLAHAEREADFARALARRLDAIAETELSEEERVTLRAVRWDSGLQAEAARYWWLNFGFVTPYSSPLSQLARLFGSFSLTTEPDRARYLARLAELAGFADSIRSGLIVRAARGSVLPREEIPLVTGVLGSFVAPPERSPFAVAEPRLAAVDSSARAGFREQVQRTIAEEVSPAFERVVAYLQGEYAAKARATVGVSHLPGGREYYRYLVRYHTTLPVTPEQVHRIGLETVRRIQGEMAAVRRQLGFTGTAAEFHRKLAADPRFFARTPEEMGDRLIAHDHRIRAQIEGFFRRTPRAQADVRRLDPRLEGAQTFGYYQQPTAADSMGHYYYNASKLPDRSLLFGAALVYHELVPGHHFQIALTQENAGLPPLRRESFHGAFTEGWGEYASGLAGEMGMYRDPYDHYGRLSMEIFLGCRLVVDTGMNWLGWSRARALAFLREHTLESPTQLETETLRYSVDMPGQALAYKMGGREMLRLRDRAKQALGSRFDIREFHEVVLGSGSLPMSVLGWKVDQWIARAGRGE